MASDSEELDGEGGARGKLNHERAVSAGPGAAGVCNQYCGEAALALASRSACGRLRSPEAHLPHRPETGPRTPGEGSSEKGVLGPYCRRASTGGPALRRHKLCAGFYHLNTPALFPWHLLCRQQSEPFYTGRGGAAAARQRGAERH